MVLVNVVKIDRQIAENLNATECRPAMSIPLIHWMNIQPRKEFETVLSETEQSEFLLIENLRAENLTNALIESFSSLEFIALLFCTNGVRWWIEWYHHDSYTMGKPLRIRHWVSFLIHSSAECESLHKVCMASFFLL